MQKTTSTYSKTFQASTGLNFKSVEYLQILRNEGKISDSEVRSIYRILTKSRWYIDNAFLIPSIGFREYTFRKVIPDLHSFIDKYTFQHPDVKSILKNIVTTYKRSKI